MKRVFDPVLKEVVIIDENKHKDRQTKFMHWSGKPFDLLPNVEAMSNEELDEILEEEEVEEVAGDEWVEWKEMSLVEIQLEYENKFGKLPMRYKNDIEWLAGKLYS